MTEPKHEQPGSFWNPLQELRKHLDRRFDGLERKLTLIMATVADLDQALTDFETATTAAETEIQSAVAAIVAKIGPGVDLAPEIARLTAVSTGLKTAADAVQAQANPTPPPAGGRRH